MKINKTFTKAAAATLAISAGVAASTVVANADTNYTVQAGDTLSSIVRKYHLSLSTIQKIAKVNHMVNVDQLQVGQVITIPDSDSGTVSTVSADAATPNNNGNAQQQSAVSDNNNNQSNTNQTNDDTQGLSPAEQEAKDWIAWHESRDQYNVSNGQYYGKYQLDISYLNGDLSAANQERVAQQYVEQRYGSWVNAKAHWEANGWY